MDFFESQDRARRKTSFLIAYFAVAVVMIVIAVYAALDLIFFMLVKSDGQPFRWWNPELFLGAAAGTSTIILLGSLYKTLELRGGGEAVAASLGGRRLSSTTTDPNERMLLNVVEEMALASGTPVPPVFLLADEEGINAFAAGYSPADAVIGVNRGTLDYLTRDELQGVIAHEFSHILNGDMRLNIRLMAILHGILLLAVIGYYLMRFSFVGSSRRDKGGGWQVVLLGLALVAIGSIGVFFARLIKASVSRQREYLADASAIQFTRNPDGLAGSLKKIGGLLRGSRVSAAEAEAASHMFFGNFRGQGFSLLSTHPPLLDRIRRLDPQFDGSFPVVRSQRPTTTTTPPPQRRASPLEAIEKATGALPGGGRFAIDPAVLLATIGAPTTNHVQRAREYLDGIPKELREAIHEAYSARAVVCALLLDPDQTIREVQLRIIRDGLGEPAASQTLRLAELLTAQGRENRLPMVEMAHNTLKELSPSQYQSFRKAILGVVRADEKIDLFEFAVHRTLLERLDRHFEHTKPPGILYPALRGVLDEATLLVSSLAHVGHGDAATAERAFNTAMDVLGLDLQFTIRPRQECSLSDVSRALDKLEASSPAVKKRIISAATVAVAVDGTVTTEEAELLRAIADSLDCPVPPLFAGTA